MDETPARRSRVAPRRLWLVSAAALVLAGCGAGGTGEGPATPARSSPAPVSSAPLRPVTHETVWLCRPGLAGNPCEGGLDATVVTAEGLGKVEPFTPATAPVADCFYVYPTVSQAPGISAPLKAAEAEIRTVRAQAARFTQACRLFAPVYRQVTRAGLTSGGLTDQKARARAYGDVLSAFNDYLNTENHGRPFVLIGHSQGSFNLIQLIQEQIDGDPALRERMLSALLLGGNVTTAPGRPDHGTFLNVPACESASQSGCVVAYSTYPGSPPKSGLFGRSTSTRVALCVSPAQLLGRGADLSAYLPTARIMGGEEVVPDAPQTGFVTLPDQITGTCRSTSSFSWLDVTIAASWLEQMPGIGAGRDPNWGLHRLDVSLALGDLVDLVAAQSEAWAQRGGPSQP